MNNNSDNNNSSNGNNNAIINSNIKKNNNGNNTVQKKLTLPLSSIPYSLKMKKEMNKNNNNNSNSNTNNKIKKPIVTKSIFQNLPAYNMKTNLFQKIKDKVSKEAKIDNKNKIKEKLESKSNIPIKKKNYNKSSTIELNKETKNENKKENQPNNNIIEKENNNFFNEEEFIDEQDEEILQINKVQSIDVKSNFMKNNYFQSNQAVYCSNPNSNSNSNKSQTKQKHYIESDDSYNKSNLFDPPSGRSNNSSKTFLTENSYQGKNTDINNPYSGAFYFSNILNNQNKNINNNNYFFPRKNMALMGSFLSTGTNSYHSGQRFDTSNSNESSGQSPHNFNVLQRQLSNNNINSNYMIQFNPLESYSNNYNSKEFIFKQPFSLNTSFYYKNKKSQFFSSNTEPKEKQIINLEDVARGIEKRTTIMIRNVPIKYKTEHLEKELAYFYGKFNCLYLPLDLTRDGNKGYGFLNLINPYHVLMFYEVFQGKCWSFFESKKMCELNFANFQGIAEITKHAKHYKAKKPKFYNITNNNNSNIEVPKKYLHLILEKNPNLKFYENNNNNTIIINSFN